MASAIFENIADIDIKQLNNFIKSNDISSEGAKFMKHTRRLQKMSKYNKAQRDKKKQLELELEQKKKLLQKEYNCILDEVNELKEMKIFYELLNIGCAFKRYSLTVIGDGYSSNTASTSDYQKYDI